MMESFIIQQSFQYGTKDKLKSKRRASKKGSTTASGFLGGMNKLWNKIPAFPTYKRSELAAASST